MAAQSRKLFTGKISKMEVIKKETDNFNSCNYCQSEDVVQFRRSKAHGPALAVSICKDCLEQLYTKGMAEFGQPIETEEPNIEEEAKTGVQVLFEQDPIKLLKFMLICAANDMNKAGVAELDFSCNMTLNDEQRKNVKMVVTIAPPTPE